MPVVGTATITVRAQPDRAAPVRKQGPPWRHRDLFLEPDLPEQADLEDDDEADGGW